MNEASCRAHLAKYLKTQGFAVDDETRFGWDIIAGNREIRWFIEVKGGDFKSAASYSVDFCTAVGQVASRIDRIGAGYRYGIAVPEEEVVRPTGFSYRSTLLRFEHALFWSALQVSLILVGEDSTRIIDPADVPRYIRELPRRGVR